LPLFGKVERIAWAIATPMPPFSPYRSHVERVVQERSPAPRRVIDFTIYRGIPQTIETRVPGGTTSKVDSPSEFEGLNSAAPTSLLPIVDARRVTPPQSQPQKTQRITVTHLEPAMLLRRIEPVYPTLPRQTHREGKVELHAIIATDGTIQSLQVIRGDVMFVKSALDAVSQWRYRPTILNGQAVEVDTTITVVYTLAH
jgi:periplasmic protein TonB